MRVAARLFARTARRYGALVLTACLPGMVWAGPINTNAAIAPGEGATVLRLQYSYAESDGQDRIAHINTSTLRTTLVHGVSAKLALFLSVPLINKQVDIVDRNAGRIEEAHDGLGDVTIMGKYRFWYEDPEPGETVRLAGILGLNVRSGDSDFTSDSYDPIIGTAYSWHKGRDKFDADLIYQINTGAGDARHDTLRYDASYSYRVAPVKFGMDDLWELDLVGELNGIYRTDGAHTLFLSPGVQYITEHIVLETSIQIPVVQDGEGPEFDYRVNTGFRLQW